LGDAVVGGGCLDDPHGIPQVLEGLDDVIEGATRIDRPNVPNVLQEDVLGSLGGGDGQDVVKQASSRVPTSALLAGVAEGLARKAPAEDVVVRHVLGSNIPNVPPGLDAKVQGVVFPAGWVRVARKDARAPPGRQGVVEAADAAEEIHEFKHT
jgi:hypothetical protein